MFSMKMEPFETDLLSVFVLFGFDFFFRFWFGGGQLRNNLSEMLYVQGFAPCKATGSKQLSRAAC